MNGHAANWSPQAFEPHGKHPKNRFQIAGWEPMLCSAQGFACPARVLLDLVGKARLASNKEELK